MRFLTKNDIISQIKIPALLMMKLACREHPGCKWKRAFLLFSTASRFRLKREGIGVEAGEGQGQVQGGREREREMDHSNPVTSVNRSIMGIKCSSMPALPPAWEEHLTGVP